VLPHIAVKKVVSGADHMALLTQAGSVYTLGNSEQGQLGRVPEMFAHNRGGRRGGQNYRVKMIQSYARLIRTFFSFGSRSSWSNLSIV
jgi:alpha-tubulin suppressor-like RCC1 family protein